MKANIFLGALLFLAINVSAQQKSYDVVSYTVPRGWQQQENQGGVQLSVSDSKTGAYALVLITKVIASGATAGDNFSAEWNKLIKGSVQVNEAPAMQPPSETNGWEIISGAASYTDGSQKGVATLLTASGGGKMTSVVLMTNTDKYQDELVSFLQSLALANVPKNLSGNTNPGTTKSNNNSSITGLWVYYTIETSGYANGFPQPSGGYFRKEYRFYPDGTYLFRMKNWAVLVKEIQFVYESGTWKLDGSKLTVTPRQGKGGWWSKSASNRTNEWGKLVRYGTWNMQPVTYTVDLNFYREGSERKIVLRSATQTEREGRQPNNEIILESRATGESLIDNPPGLKTGFENK